MNEVFISGKISALAPADELSNPHYSFEIVSSPQDKNGHISFVFITINAWNTLAAWAIKNLHVNDQVLVKGSLIQAPEKSVPLGIEIAATHIIMI